jgi:hypothetical protein
MIKDDRIINSLVYGDMVHKLAKGRNIELTEARTLISKMSFSEYRALEEASVDIVPPSGQTITPTSTQSQPAATAPTTTSTTGKPDPRGVQVKNPKTGKMEWMIPATAQAASNGQVPAITPPQVAEDAELSRMCQLAGIKENCSAGATGAGSIAVAPAAMGKVNRRQDTNEQKPVEYTRTEPPKTIIGDTKPGQASGELSANLAARGKKTASRNKNGLRR